MDRLGDGTTRDKQRSLLSSSQHPNLRFKSSCRSLCPCLLDFFFRWACVSPSEFFAGTLLWLAGPAQEGPELAEARNSLVSAASPGLEATKGKRGGWEHSSCAGNVCTARGL